MKTYKYVIVGGGMAALSAIPFFLVIPNGFRKSTPARRVKTSEESLRRCLPCSLDLQYTFTPSASILESETA